MIAPVRVLSGPNLSYRERGLSARVPILSIFRCKPLRSLCASTYFPVQTAAGRTAKDPARTWDGGEAPRWPPAPLYPAY
jgi:hypothetical protein